MYVETLYSSVRLLALMYLYYLQVFHLSQLKLSCSVSDELMCHSSVIHSHISRVLKSGTIADISNNPSNREHSQNFDFFRISLKVMNKYSSCNVNRMFLLSYLVFSNVLKTLTITKKKALML